MKILLTGGGTAGHVMPHLALMSDFRKYFKDIVYVGSISGMEKDIIKKQKDITYHEIVTTKFVRRKIWKNLLIPFKLIKAIHQSKKIIKQEQPSVVFSKGGYVSLPVVIASKRCKVPVVAHESDLEMGLANKLSKPYAKVICTTFEKTSERCKKAIWTGSPIRKDMIKSKQEAMKNLDINTSLPILAITGGSLGSRFINNKIWDEIYNLTTEFYVLHLTGKNNINQKLLNIPNYKQIDFTMDIGSVLSASDIIVSRAGSNTIFELAVMHKPMLLIPLPKGNSRGDQVDNAKYFNSQGFANFVTEEQLEKQTLKNHIMQTYKERNILISNLKKSGICPGNEKIIKIILQNTKPDIQENKLKENNKKSAK